MFRTDRGRTYDRSRPNRSKRQKSACHGGPSTYDIRDYTGLAERDPEAHDYEIAVLMVADESSSSRRASMGEAAIRLPHVELGSA